MHTLFNIYGFPVLSKGKPNPPHSNVVLSPSLTFVHRKLKLKSERRWHHEHEALRFHVGFRWLSPNPMPTLVSSYYYGYQKTIEGACRSHIMGVLLS